jgi:hypothetical protein
MTSIFLLNHFFQISLGQEMDLRKSRPGYGEWIAFKDFQGLNNSHI